MHALIQFPVVVLLFVLIRAGDLAISAAVARNTIRAVLYGVVAVLSLIVVILAVLGL